MAINLVSLVQQFLTPQMVSSLARAVGINEAVAQKLVAAALPAILAALGTAAAAPGGAQKVSDAISNSDPDLLTKLSGAVTGGNTQLLNEGANLLSGILGGGGLASLAGALSQYSGAPQGAVQPLLGAVTHAVVGTLGQQDPSNWSDPSAIALAVQQPEERDRRCAAAEVSRALSGSGLLAGLGGAAAAASQTATSTVSSAASAASFDRKLRRQERPGGVQLERLPDVGDHSHRHRRAGGDLLVCDPKPRNRAGENRHVRSAGADRIRVAGGALPGRLKARLDKSGCMMGLGWARAYGVGCAQRSGKRGGAGPAPASFASLDWRR